MEEKLEALQNLKDIKGMMEQSSRFLSLSGLSGVFSGLFGLAGGSWLLMQMDKRFADPKLDLFWMDLATVGVAVLVLALLAGLILTYRKAKRMGHRVVTSLSIRLGINLFLPLVAGGIFCLAVFFNKITVGDGSDVTQNYLLYAPITLIFYGIGLINAGKYTLHNIRSLGVLEMVLGIAALFITDLKIQMYLWMTGFGILHIIYGTVMYFKYERNS